MGFFEDDIRRDMGDPAYAAGRLDAVIELLGITASAQFSTPQGVQHAQAFSIAAPGTVTSTTGAFLMGAPPWVSAQPNLSPARA